MKLTIIQNYKYIKIYHIHQEMQQQQPEKQNRQILLTHQILQNFNIYTHSQTHTFPLSQQTLKMTVQQLIISTIKPKLGYSSRIHLYRQPLCPSNKIDYYNKQLPLSQIIKQVGAICFTYNNTQYIQQPDYNHQPNYSRPLASDTIQIVVQIMQNNWFVHENYRIPVTSKISFFHNVCNRYGNYIYFRYYNMQIPIGEFGTDSLVEHTVARLVDHMGRLNISVDSVQRRGNGVGLFLQECCQQRKEFYIQQKYFFKLFIDDNGQQTNKKCYIIDRRCRLSNLRYILQIHFKVQVSLYCTSTNKQLQTQYIPSNQTTLNAKLKKQTNRIITLKAPIYNCQIVGHTGNTKHNTLQLFIIKQSSILYRIYVDIINMKALLYTVCHLPCTNTLHLDQDLFYISRTGHLVSYSIHPNMVRVKYYTSDGQLMMLKVFPWYHELYQIQFYVVDMFCVRLKTDRKKIRIFYIDDPQHYVQIGPSTAFYPARMGSNVYSDGSGLFASINQWLEGVEVWSLSEKKMLNQIRLFNNKQGSFKQICGIFFTEKQQLDNTNRKIILNFNNKILTVYQINKGQLLYNILCQKGMSTFFCIGQNIVCCMGSQIRIYNPHKSEQKNEKIQWKQPKRIPQKSALILPETNKILIPNTLATLQFSQFNTFYVY